MTELIVAPSILAADWGNFKDEVANVSRAGADWIHIDVMDGHFVPPITFGAQVVSAIRSERSLPLDVHLMIEQPERQLQAFADAGAHSISVHAETCPHLHRTVQEIHTLGLKAGVALNPSTPLSVVSHVLSEIDLLLLMTVNPGWGGQKFIPSMVDKISHASKMIKDSGRSIVLEVDGGITPETSAEARAAGANALVAGTSVFKSRNYKEAIAKLRA